MLRILLNGAEKPTDPACRNWRELLEQLDSAAEAQGQVVTAVRFDGVEQPSFRDAVFLSRPMSGLTLVEAESASPRDLLMTSIDEAVVAARTLAAGAERIGAAFRGFDVVSANQDLLEMAQGLGTLVAIVQALSQAIGVGLDKVRCGGQVGTDMIDELSAHADLLIKSQESGDWITVADVIEYDIAPALNRWPGLFESLRAAAGQS